MAMLSNQFEPVAGRLFHGSPVGFKPGDRITPHTDDTWGVKATYSTRYPEDAANFAADRSYDSKGQGRLFGSVYEVEPTSTLEPHPFVTEDYQNKKADAEKRGRKAPDQPPPGDMPIDRQGMRVVRHHAFVTHPAIGSNVRNRVGVQETP